MNRKEFLRKLLEKTQQGDEYMRNQLDQGLEDISPITSIKRMQVLHMGICHFGLPTPQYIDNPIMSKSKTKTRQILTVERARTAKKREEAPKPKNQFNTQNQSQHNNSVKPATFHNIPYIKNENSKTDELKEQSLNRRKQRVLISRRSLTLSDSAGQTKGSQPTSNHNFQQKTRHIFSSANPVFNRNYSSRKSIPKKNSKDHDYHDFRKQQNESRIIFRKQINKNYARPYNPPPKITAKAYIIYEKLPETLQNPSFKIHAAFNSKNSFEVASLTKIMTCFLAIKLCQKYQLDPEEQFVKIGKFESSIGGTSAKIQIGDIYTLQDLFYGLMLPSGNDASLAIAVWGGRKLLEYETETISQVQRKKSKKACYDRFIREMNNTAREVGMTKTSYANSHGLINSLNRSCAFDIVNLSQRAMQNEKFKKIVGTKHYSNRIRIQIKNLNWMDEEDEDVEKEVNVSEEEDPKIDQNRYKKQKMFEERKSVKWVESSREVSWQNSHKLLWKKGGEYLGIKTGVTKVAGPCLSSLVVSESGREFYIVVLNCKKMNLRFKETQILKKWIYKQQGIKSMKKTNNTPSKAHTTESESDFLEDDKEEEDDF